MPKRKPSVRPQPLLAVRDVRKSAKWYETLFAFDRDPPSDHDDLYDRLWSGGALVMQLHAWDREDHPNLRNRKKAPVGHGVLVWMEVDDFDAVVRRTKKLRARVLVAPHVNPAPMHREIWLRDPDGYVVVAVSPDGEAEKKRSGRMPRRRRAAVG